MTHPDRPRALLIGVSQAPALPWWWRHVDHHRLACKLEYEPLRLKGGRPASPFSWPFVVLCVRVAFILFRARRRGVRYVFSFECDWLSFVISGLQSLLMFRQPRHIIVQFIMREKTDSLKSRLKYSFMKWAFSSVYLCVCSSRTEADYYAQAFGWPTMKLAFVPFHTDPAFVERPRVSEESFMVSAGRTFRDYPTLLQALAGTETPMVVVAGRSSFDGAAVPSHVTTLFDIPLAELIGLISRSMAVVLPLQDRAISVGQSVLLEAMAMGKPVIVTRCNGTVDYIEHMKTGILVPPRDPNALRAALELVAGDPVLRRKIGEAARERVLMEHLPNHYALGVAKVLSAAR